MRCVNSVTVLLLVAGCTYNPVIDPKTSRHPENYQADLGECRQISEQAPGGGAGALGGAGVGAALGAGVAVATGRPERVGQAAGGGAVLGGASGGARTSRGKAQIVRNCLKARGYSVLN